MTNRIKRGSTALMALFAMVILLIVTMGVAGYSVQGMYRSRMDEDRQKAFQASQAGLELGISRAYSDLAANKGIFLSGSRTISSDLNDLAPGCVATTLVSPQPDNTWAWVTSTVTYKGVTKSVRSLIRARNVGIWNNAIFAGTGASGQAINGNVDIRGSVHILGEGEAYSDLNKNGVWDPAETYTDTNKNGVWDPGEPFTDTNLDGIWNSAEPYNDTNKNGFYDPPLTQTDLNSSFSGNAYIGNNYSGMDAGLEALVPAAPRISGIETLSTEVRVKHGRIAISGSATIGATGSIDGGTSKGTIDGSYVSDGFTGTKGSSAVFSDNGTNNAYDLGSVGIEFPLISGIGAQPFVAPNGTIWSNQEAYLDSQALTINLSSITATTLPFTLFDLKGNSITFVPEGNKGNPPAKLIMNGIIRTTGDIQIGASKETITYEGNGTLFSKGNISISSHLLPASGKIFPTSARIGLIAKNNLNIATGGGDAQLKLAGAFYAQGKIVSAKQNEIMGTFVANFYDLGTNVPKIYQVPALPTNMPPAMPGDKLFFTLKNQSWRERK
ncbi:MAG: hypothetical protein KF784_15415 [Fimbriimonadaceae bacterium]|nr:hypothetical protein [Fimbriimonadaceae bacterium]